MRGRALLLGPLLAAALLLAAAVPALAATPGPTPGPRPSPSISPPSRQQIEDARNALARLRNPGKSSGKSTGSPTTLTEVAGPTTEPARHASPISDQAWWTIGAGLLVLVVASEATRISVRRAKHRRGA